VNEKELLIEYFEKFYERTKTLEEKSEKDLQIDSQFYFEGAKDTYDHIIDILTDDKLREEEFEKLKKENVHD
jgi:hypothetical protein